MPARLCLDVRNIVGESLVWSPDDRSLFWVDIVGKHIHRFDPVTQRHDAWHAPDFPTSIALRSGGGFIVGLRRDICFWRPGGTFDRVATPEPDLADNRLNEGRVAPDGSFWVGTMQNNLTPLGDPAPIDRDVGAYYRIDNELAICRLTPAEYGITNTMAWLPDGRFVTADTTKNVLYAFDYAPAGDRITNRRIFAEGFDRGLPDGSCVDAAGYLWNCRVAGGACVARFAPDGHIDSVLETPCTWPTSCAFGGLNLDTLYVTSARFTMSDDHLATNPHEGGLFVADVGGFGLVEQKFKG
jgi:sugar lactone lactonase YvrE